MCAREAGEGARAGIASEADVECIPRLRRALTTLARICCVVGGLYFFICSLSFLSDSFRLLAGKQAGEIFQNSVLSTSGEPFFSSESSESRFQSQPT